MNAALIYTDSMAPRSKLAALKKMDRRAAERAGLRYVQPSETGFTRRRSGKNKFRFVTATGRPIRDAGTLTRIRKLAIPPAYENVWICKSARGHLQFMAEDARGRKQYRYHAQWTEVRNQEKYRRILSFARALPKIRAATAVDLQLLGLPREKVLATVVRLLEKTLIRVGNDEYARTNHSYGLSTLQDRHVQIDHGKIKFRFKGKSNVRHEIALDDPELAEIVRECRDVPGQSLFQYVDEEGGRHEIHSQDVNQYLKSIAGDGFTAKDFRTWAATVLAATALRELADYESSAEAKRHLNQAIESVAARLGNTKAICRKSYIHPEVVAAYLDGEVIRAVGRRLRGKPRIEPHSLDEDEKRVLAFLKKRVAASEKK